MKIIRLSTLSLVFLFVTSMSFSQSFIAAVSDFDMSNDCKMELTDGSKIEGKIFSLTSVSGNISAVTLKDAEGNKHKHKAETIQRFYVKMGFLAKLDAASEASSSISEMVHADFNEIMNREYIIYEQALIPKKKDKYRLLQLINPGFDNLIKVFDDPNAKETGGFAVGDLQLSGGEDKSYLLVINGQKAISVKKNKYDNLFTEIYADCPEMIKLMDGEKIKFKDMAAHVFIADQLCGIKK